MQFETEAKKAEEEGTEYFIPADWDIGTDFEIPMKLDPSTIHFICKRCGLYATREQISDIRDRLNRRESTKEDKQYDYLEWWQKSKKDKQLTWLYKMGKKQSDIPEDVNKELESPKFGKPTEITASGYVLDINEKDSIVDIQSYEPISGTTILEGLSISKKIKLNDLEKGTVYEFKLDELKAPLSKKTIEYLKEQGITMNAIIQFELKETKIID